MLLVLTLIDIVGVTSYYKCLLQCAFYNPNVSNTGSGDKCGSWWELDVVIRQQYGSNILLHNKTWTVSNIPLDDGKIRTVVHISIYAECSCRNILIEAIRL